ncbi:MAG: serine/threonine-protein kinase [Bacteroidota bacterium]
MDADRWNRLYALFDDACARPPAERLAFLRAACGDDDALYAEAAALVAADANTDVLLDGVALDVIALDDVGSAAAALLGDLDLVGTQVGPYHLVRQLGTGGMGDVYLAERASADEQAQFEQQVALKLVKPGMDSRQVLRRFQQERQILARLDHPHIARLLDGGVTERGQPYFVMEYVEGVPIDAYCDAHRLTVDERLGLFQDACRAVLYAHSQLVVHRDLKPSNILVTESADGQPGPRKPIVKLLDFGIAKLLAEDDDATALTRTGGAVMTPAYASPEQVRGEPVGTGTDIYSLGVVLYELLAGQRPYALPERDRLAAVQMLAQQEPEPPSTVVRRATTGADATGPGATGTQITEARRTQPERLRRRLTGDLDVICLTALRTEPERRYPTVAALLDDVRRHLTGLPVTARRDTAAYRLGKFVQRHRVGVVATVVVGVLFAALASFYTVRLAAERDRAQAEAAKATEIAAFLEGIFEVADPSIAQGDTVTARALLDEGAARIETELAGEPEVQAQMMTVMGNVYRSLGLYEDAERLYTDALALRETLFGPRHADVASSLDDLGAMDYARGNYARGAERYQQALAIKEALYAPTDAEVLTSLTGVARAMHWLDSLVIAESLYVHVLDQRRAHHAADTLALANALLNVGAINQLQRRFEEAEPYFQEGLALLRAHSDASPLQISEITNDLGVLLKNLERYGEAEPLYRETLAIRQRILGDTHPRVATSLNNLGAFLRSTEQYEEALDVSLRAVEVYRAALGDDHPEYAIGINNLASSYDDVGDTDQALRYYRESLDVMERALGSEHTTTNALRLNLGSMMLDVERYAEAEALLRTAYGHLLASQGPDARYTKLIVRRLHQVYEGWGRPERGADLPPLPTEA